MIAMHLKPHHIGQKFSAKADGASSPLKGGLSDYVVMKNRGGKAVEVVVYINGGSLKLRPDSFITPIEEATA